jgi:hypothetical protein
MVSQPGSMLANWHDTPSELANPWSMSSIKRDVKKKVLPRPEAEKILVSRSSPLFSSLPILFERFFALACLLFPTGSSAGGDDANRVLKLGKRNRYWNVSRVGGGARSR